MLEQINCSQDIKKLNTIQLEALCNDIRQCLIDTVTVNGGHLASNLGSVEFSVALEYVFDAADKIVWDVGHQCYTHKLLNNRKELFNTLRQWNGISGFPKPNEDASDVFATGHSSTSLSVGLGLARARDINNEKFNVISVIGDGALTGGLSYEALNNIDDTKMLIVLNDNNMSIGKNVGGLSRSLTKMRVGHKYVKFKQGFKNFLSHIPLIGKPLVKMFSAIKRWFKYTFLDNLYFDNFGIRYIGPVDGHNIKDLVGILSEVKQNLNKPTLIHIVTKKGKGYLPSEEDPEKFHGLSGSSDEKYKYSLSTVVGDTLIELAGLHNNVAVVNAAMVEGCGVGEFANKFSERFFDVGIAEAHAVTYAAGLASGGIKPYVTVYSTFLQRAYDSIIHDVCIGNIPVVFCIDHAGLVGADGETHQGIFDISFLSSMPNMTILAPKDAVELKSMLLKAYEINSPVAIRYPKGCDTQFDVEIGDIYKWQSVYGKGEKIQLLCVGASMLAQAIKAVKDNNLECLVNVVNARCIKPLDTSFIDSIDSDSNIITVEDNTIIGGFGSLVNDYLALKCRTNKITNLGVNDEFVKQGSILQQTEYCNLSSEKIASLIKELLK